MKRAFYRVGRDGPSDGGGLKRAGLDKEAMGEAISEDAARGWRTENRLKTMTARQYNHGFAVEWMCNDLGICLDEARRADASSLAAAPIDRFYAEVEKRSGRRRDIPGPFARQEFARRGTA